MRLVWLYLLCAPWDLAVLVLSLALVPLGARRARFVHGVCWLDVRDGSLLHRRWAYSTTLGHVVVLQPGCAGGMVERHELVHVRQYEGAVCSVWLAALFALVVHTQAEPVFAWLGLVLLGPWWSYAGGSLAALLRGKRPYLDNPFERHARAETTLHESLTSPKLDNPVIGRSL